MAICLGACRGRAGAATVSRCRPRRRRADGIARCAVLGGGGVDERGELVDLEEGASGLGDADPHALAAGGVAVDVAVLDGLVEDRGERVDELADRGGAERSEASSAAVAEVGAGGDRVAELACLAQLVRLEGEAELARRSRRGGSEAKNGSRWREAPAVVARCSRRSACRRARRRASPSATRRVLVEGRHRAVGCGAARGRRLGRVPDAGRTRARMLPSSARAAGSSQPPPHPQAQPARSCRTPLPLAVARKRRWKARVPSARTRR